MSVCISFLSTVVEQLKCVFWKFFYFPVPQQVAVDDAGWQKWFALIITHFDLKRAVCLPLIEITNQTLRAILLGVAEVLWHVFPLINKITIAHYFTKGVFIKLSRSAVIVRRCLIVVLISSSRQVAHFCVQFADCLNLRPKGELLLWRRRSEGSKIVLTFF